MEWKWKRMDANRRKTSTKMFFFFCCEKWEKAKNCTVARRAVLNTRKIIVNSLSCGFAGTSSIMYAAARACANLWLAHLYSSTSFRLIFTKNRKIERGYLSIRILFFVFECSEKKMPVSMAFMCFIYMLLFLLLAHCTVYAVAYKFSIFPHITAPLAQPIGLFLFLFHISLHSTVVIFFFFHFFSLCFVRGCQKIVSPCISKTSQHKMQLEKENIRHIVTFRTSRKK